MPSVSTSEASLNETPLGDHANISIPSVSTGEAPIHENRQQNTDEWSPSEFEPIHKIHFNDPKMPPIMEITNNTDGSNMSSSDPTLTIYDSMQLSGNFQQFKSDFQESSAKTHNGQQTQCTCKERERERERVCWECLCVGRALIRVTSPTFPAM